MLLARPWATAACGCKWRYGFRSLAFLACQGHAPSAPQIRMELAMGTASTGGGR